MKKKVQASPTKDFFVRMITRDITLEDCILDLLDNSIDAAGGCLQDDNLSLTHEDAYEGYGATIQLSRDSFQISDNCGGISLDAALYYAFHFGRRPDAPPDAEFSIGLYGIGMKRAIFKLGRIISIKSSTSEAAFDLDIDVQEWLGDADTWDFDLNEDYPRAITGTDIYVSALNEGFSEVLADPEFESRLVRTISRDYSLFLQRGFVIQINDTKVTPYAFTLRESSDFQPFRVTYEDQTGVEVDIVAGMAGDPPNDTSAQESERYRAETYYGWFVACNDRIVLAADKSSKTGWGHDKFPSWHFQYNGFMGFVNFKSSEPDKLPWTTTKREIDPQSGLYRRALVAMKKAARAFIDYTNERKDDLETARKQEASTVPKPISSVPQNATLATPKFVSKPKVEQANVNYTVELRRLKRVAKALGNAGMTYRQVGIETFEYFYENEVSEED